MTGTDIAVGGSGVAVTMGLTQVLKTYINDRYHALLSLLIGILVGGGIQYTQGADLVTSIFTGIITGLMASGVYDQTHIVTR